MDRKAESGISNGLLTKVFYSLSKTGRFGTNIGLKPEESYRLGDSYQWILRTATLGIYTPIWDKSVKNKCAVKTIVGTPIDDMLYKQDFNAVGNFSHRHFARQEVERGFTEAFKEGSIKKKLIDNEIRYVINERLKKFVFSDCWNVLYIVTRSLIENVLVLKKISKNDPAYKTFKNWLVYLNEEKFALKIIEECTNKRKQQYSKPKYKQKLFKDTIVILASIADWKKQAIAIYEASNDKETTAKFENLKKSLLYYTCPEYILDAVKNILISFSGKY